MTRALNRSIPFWILLAASIGLIVAGLLTVLDHLGTMTATLKNGSATGLAFDGHDEELPLDPEGALDAPASPHAIEREQQAASDADDATAEEEESQNGSSGSSATATKISVK